MKALLIIVLFIAGLIAFGFVMDFIHTLKCKIMIRFSAWKIARMAKRYKGTETEKQLLEIAKGLKDFANRLPHTD